MRTFGDVEPGKRFIIPRINDVILPFAPVMKKIDRRIAVSLANGYTMVVDPGQEVIELCP